MNNKASEDQGIVQEKNQHLDNLALRIYTHFVRYRTLNATKPHYIEFKNGDCHCNDRQIDFPNKNSLYFLLVRALYECAQVDGFCSYEEIDAFFVKHRHPTAENADQRKKRITNALEELYKTRTDQKILFPKIASDGNEIIEKDRFRKGLVFYNPVIDR